jgi:pimeloyl-ACP methyl ester carboxylesterase
VQHLTGSDVPVTVIYGDRDSVIPARLSAQVADQASALAERVVLANADHNDPVMFGPRVADAVARLADTVA